MQKRKNARGGFTLIEVLLVVVIIGLLAAIVAPRLVGRSQEARITAAQADLSVIAGALTQFELDNGYFPTTDEGLLALIEEPTGRELTKWRRYLDRNTLPVDPWGNEYVYLCPGSMEDESFDLYSTGPDGKDGGDDDVHRAGYEEE